MQLALLAIVTAIAGEFKVTPFSGELFRIGLGSSAFLLCLLLMRQLPYVRAGIMTGITVLLFRTTMDSMTSFETFSLIGSLQDHFSAALYYIAFALGMSLIQGRLSEFHPFLLGGCVACIDFISNEIELLARSLLFDLTYFYTGQWVLIGATAVVRSFFVVGLYSSIMISQMRALHLEQQKRMEQMLSVSSGLYGEVFYLRKSMDTIERITAQSHDLYGKLMEAGEKESSRSMLQITQQIHEVKKDSQRILAGLLKLFDRETASDMTLSEIVDFVIKSNRKYGQMLKKEVEFESSVGTDYVTAHFIPLITVLNNLVSNAVEAIEKKGKVGVRIYEQGGKTVMTVSDTGIGIAEQDKSMIFEPGFTTKFNQDGYAATGIGLSHVRDIVHSTGGTIWLQSAERAGETTFVVVFSTDMLKKGV
ncbi:sensor histidine kinase [Paenibacillus abyssi]|uniref:histidine kinase n=1 Tax=Paenibacillus abyssi TaxID=1340531 RepID=A0A917D2T1_9BACL|nr:sensor histidine kinase [Paenibacillus abyssi]GGG08518.1 sensor histidine kinase [Paenibacillus abyssi]